MQPTTACLYGSLVRTYQHPAAAGGGRRRAAAAGLCGGRRRGCWRHARLQAAQRPGSAAARQRGGLASVSGDGSGSQVDVQERRWCLFPLQPQRDVHMC